MKEKFQVPGIIESVATRADATLKITLGTQELSAEESATLFALKGKPGWFVFSENVLAQQDIPNEPAPEFKRDKSPSQRLRAFLWQYWDKCTSHKPDFETFYRQWIEHKINGIKDNLPNS